jgi:hypothetical protein
MLLWYFGLCPRLYVYVSRGGAWVLANAGMQLRLSLRVPLVLRNLLCSNGSSNLAVVLNLPTYGRCGVYPVAGQFVVVDVAKSIPCCSCTPTGVHLIS